MSQIVNKPRTPASGRKAAFPSISATVSRRPAIVGGQCVALLAALAASGPLFAWDSCDHKRELNERLALGAATQLSITVGAGDLEIVGKGGLEEALIEGTVCAAKAEDAEATRLLLTEGERAEIVLDMPQAEGGWFTDAYVYTDLRIVVPERLALDIRDTSGDVEVRQAGSVKIKDSSGDLDIFDSASVEVEDSSGDIGVRDIAGDVTIVSDSSGDIEGEGVGGSVLVGRDSSGDIEFAGVSGDVMVERDSSGDISARDVAGDFDVLRDGSGSISHRNIDGEVRIPDDKR